MSSSPGRGAPDRVRRAPLTNSTRSGAGPESAATGTGACSTSAAKMLEARCARRLVVAGALDRARDRHAGLRGAAHGDHALDVLHRVAAGPGVGPMGLREAVAALPGPQALARHSGERGEARRGNRLFTFAHPLHPYAMVACRAVTGRVHLVNSSRRASMRAGRQDWQVETVPGRERGSSGRNPCALAPVARSGGPPGAGGARRRGCFLWRAASRGATRTRASRSTTSSRSRRSGC